MRVFALLRPPFPVDQELVGHLLEVAGEAMALVESAKLKAECATALEVLQATFDELQDLGYVVYWEY
jgi:hypothetical protein